MWRHLLRKGLLPAFFRVACEWWDQYVELLVRGCDVFLVGVVELTGGGLVGVREVFVSDADESDRWDLYEY